MFVWIFIIWAILYALAELPINGSLESICDNNDQSFGLSFAGMGIFQMW